MTDLQKTPLHDEHLRLDARMVPFAGFSMPVQYPAGVLQEYRIVREGGAGIFDISHMGQARVSGPDALAFLQYVTTNDVAMLTDGQVQYSALLNGSGTFIDDITTYRVSEDQYLLCLNAANRHRDVTHLQQYAGPFDVAITDESDATTLLALQGGHSQGLLQPLCDIDLERIGYYRFAQGEVCGHTAIMSRTGYTGEDGFEIYLTPDQAEEVWKKTAEAGEPMGMKLVGLGARDSLRLEMKMALYGNDMDADTTALEAGLAWIVKLDKGEFIGRDALLKQKESGIPKRLVCVEFSERCVPRHGYPLVDCDGEESGVVTSGAFSPSLKKPIALGYLPTGKHKSGMAVSVKIRDKLFAGEVVKPPFYKHGSHR